MIGDFFIANWALFYLGSLILKFYGLILGIKYGVETKKKEEVEEKEIGFFRHLLFMFLLALVITMGADIFEIIIRL